MLMLVRIGEEALKIQHRNPFGAASKNKTMIRSNEIRTSLVRICKRVFFTQTTIQNETHVVYFIDDDQLKNILPSPVYHGWNARSMGKLSVIE